MKKIFKNVVEQAAASSLNIDYLELQEMLFLDELKQLKRKYINILKKKKEKKNIINFKDLKKRA
ncbi:hypothetical protein [uncultured Clostridium sp.]|uniref:hypothetical protein n=1 Tax=uncultured Clostridium sp. TaxID=59620 RepID=UPI0025D6B45D|nr:hypothetical protein [uncultured Clostridium sp.]